MRKKIIAADQLSPESAVVIFAGDRRRQGPTPQRMAPCVGSGRQVPLQAGRRWRRVQQSERSRHFRRHV